MVERSCRSHTERTPKGEMLMPRLRSSFDTRTCPKAGLLDRQGNDGLLDLRCHAVLQDGFAPRDLLQGQLPAFVVELLEAIEAVTRIAHHLAGLADIAELLGQFEEASLGPDDLLLFSHGGVLWIAVAGAAQPRPASPPPRLSFELRLTPYVRLSQNFYT